MSHRRVFLIVLDSLGVGALPDAAGFGDEGTHTLDHLAAAAGGLRVPNLEHLGLGCIEGVASVPRAQRPAGAFGRAREVSAGKDTQTGHWELMRCPLEHAFPTYPKGFPPAVIDPLLARTGLDGVLGNEAASGTQIIERLGSEHIASGRPIVYTSADSVFQVAAHEEAFGLARLYEVCSVAREITRPLGLGRVIARPFVGRAGAFERTYNRRDYALAAPRETSLDRLTTAGVPVVGVGKIEDIFARRGISRAIHTAGNADGVAQTLALMGEQERGLVFVNLIDFDMLYGHRRDPQGYRRALETFDASLGELLGGLRDDDLLMLTADHGNDPTHSATTDHTREYVPLLACGPPVAAGVDLATRPTLADVGATVEELLGLPAAGDLAGSSFAPMLLGDRVGARG